MESWFLHFGTEILGTMFLIVLGNGVVANVNLKNTNGNGGGLIAIATGWALAVAIGATVSSSLGGKAHLNPAVTIAMIANGWEKNVGDFNLIPIFFLGQIVGGILGQIIVDTFYFKHILDTAYHGKGSVVLSIHCTIPTKRNVYLNFFAELIGTAVLVTAIISTTKWFVGFSFMSPLFVGIVVFAIGLSLGGTTGYAINPVRDLIPRTLHQLLPIKHKVKSDWGYAWIPVIAPLMGGVIVGSLFLI